MPDPRVAAAKCNAQLTALWLSTCVDGDIPSKVRQFLYEDVPHLFGLLGGLHDEQAQPTGADQIVETARMADLLEHLVDLARLANDATATSADPTCKKDWAGWANAAPTCSWTSRCGRWPKPTGRVKWDHTNNQWCRGWRRNGGATTDDPSQDVLRPHLRPRL